MARIPNSCLVSAFPARSGLGRSAANLFRLGFFDQGLFLKFHRSDSESGFSRVVRSRWELLGGIGAYASQYFPSAWKDALRPFDFVHFQSPHFFHLAPAVRRATGTVHDVLFFDPTHDRGYPLGSRTYFRHEFQAANRMGGLVIDSEQTQRAVAAISPELRTKVIHLWTDPTFTVRDRTKARRDLGLPLDPVILLNVSSDESRKNIEILPRILNELGRDFLLVRIGRSERIIPAFHHRNVVALDSVSDEQYPLYFNAADMVIQPSREEGFGYPIIEAINSGTPVLASAIPIFRELLGADYPFCLNPDSPGDWINAARAVTTTLRNPSAASELYRHIGSYYREERGAQEFTAFFREAGVI
jgi:glycosyltransferase involved in cell wall biosynthesis